jgi:hypothetical protein
MARRLRWIVLVAVVLVVIAAVLAVLLVRPGLQDARDRVDATWTPLRHPLAVRYIALARVGQALQAAGAGGRTVTRDLDAALGRWAALARHPDRDDDPAAEATAADLLEALARRVHANVSASDKLKANTPLLTALQAYDQALAPPVAVRVYNRAVRAYEHKRTGTVAHVVAGVLGYDSRPVLVNGT